MPKTQTTHPKKQAPENKPLNTSRYIGFYLTLLILSTVGTSFGIFGLFGIPEVIRQFELSPLYASLSLFNVLVILPVAIWALVLLWLKRPLGIWLKLGTYAVSIVSSAISLFAVSPIIKDFTKKALAEAAKSSDQKLSSSLVEGITSFTIYAGFTLAIAVSVIFGLLWWFAWKKQAEADSE